MRKENKVKETKGLVIYQAKNGASELRGDLARETLWATLDQIAAVGWMRTGEDKQ
jgi:hypothetical protein